MTEQRKVALVTGATGFVGRHLCRRLLAEGWAVHAIVRESSASATLPNYREAVVRTHFVSETGHELFRIVGEVRPDVVFHLASLFLAQHRSEDILPMLQSNIILGTQLVEAMARNRVFNLVNTGTSWQHYGNEAFNPVCLYAATKQAFEAILCYYQEVEGLRAITLKLFDTYGPEDTRGKLMSLLEKLARSGESLAMSPGEQLLDLVYIDDVVEAFLMAARHVCRGECLADYAVSSGNAVSLRQVVEVFETITAQRLNIVWGGRPYRNREVMLPWDRGKPLPGWTARVSLTEGIRRCREGNERHDNSASG